MRALFCDRTVFHIKNSIAGSDRRQSVRNHQDCLVFQIRKDKIIKFFFETNIHCSSRLVHNQDIMVFIKNACKRNPLPLSAGKIDSVRTEFFRNNSIQLICCFGNPRTNQSFPDFFQIGILVHRNIFCNRRGIQVEILEQRRISASVSAGIHLFYRHSII